jgi:PAS domain S-box-containing protein
VTLDALGRVTADANAIDPLLDEAPCGFVAFADDGTIRLANRTLLEMLGYERAELSGRHVESILNVGSRIFYQTHFFPLLRLHGHAEEIFLLLRGKNGEDVAALVNGVRRERAGEWVTECILIPVKERRKFEDALLRAKKAAEDAQAVAETHRRELQEANRQLELQAAELEVTQQQLLEQADELEIQQESLRATNDELVARTAELERQRSLAEEANKAKSAFLAMMSHELRTPLNAIGGYAQLLEMGIHGPVTTAQLEALGKIARSQRHLLRLINDVLNLARIESGRVNYHLEVFPLREVVDTVLPMVEPQLAARGLRYELQVPAELKAYADREKVQQILLNLLSNAIKFTPVDGCVSLDAFADPSRADRVYVRVRDTGIGIPEDRLDDVFEPFVQVDVSHARRAEGTGLGLAISRDLARGMGGDLRARSEEGTGSSVTLTLPREGGG